MAGNTEGGERKHAEGFRPSAVYNAPSIPSTYNSFEITMKMKS